MLLPCRMSTITNELTEPPCFALAAVTTAVSNFSYILNVLQNSTFLDAQRYCQKDGGQLASFPDLATYTAVLDAIRSANVISLPLIQLYDGIWVGFWEYESEGAWEWIDSSPVRYVNFGGIEWSNPFQTNQLNCATMHIDRLGEAGVLDRLVCSLHAVPL